MFQKEVDEWVKDLHSKISNIDIRVKNLELEFISMKKLINNIVMTLHLLQKNLEFNNSIVQMHNDLILSENNKKNSAK